MKNLDANEDIPDLTLSEIDEDDEYGDAEEALEEYREGRQEFFRLCEIIFTAIFLTEMFEEDYITFREYFALTDYLEEAEAELDVRLI